MRLFLEDEGALDLKLPYEELATKVADAVLDLSLIHIPSPRDRTRSRMPSSA